MLRIKRASTPAVAWAMGVVWALVCASGPLAHAQPAGTINDEAKVPPYSLPDPLALTDGRRVTDAEAWRRDGRPATVRLFEEHVFGRTPQLPVAQRVETLSSEPRALDGLATRKVLRIHWEREGRKLSMDLLLYLPNAARGAPCPAFLGLNFQGNHAITDEPGVPLNAGWMPARYEGVKDHRATEASRGREKGRHPLRAILGRGFALATAYMGDVDPDEHDGFKNGVHGLMQPDPAARRPDDWGALAAWAWGLSRALDALQAEPGVDGKRVAVWGHSRLGKAALWAGALDERFALVISNQSGAGGAALSKRIFGETVKHLTTNFPHWFCGRFKEYAGREEAMPVDHHQLIALVAPRPVLVCSAEEDRWADPRGEFLAVQKASPVYRLLGVPAMPDDLAYPAPLTLTPGVNAYHLRPGKHDVLPEDWEVYLKFAEAQGLKPAAAAQANAAAQQPSVYDLPGLQQGHAMVSRKVAMLFAQSRYAEAEQALRQLAQALPFDAGTHYNLACALARLGRREEALTTLEKAVDLGFRNAGHIGGDPDLESLRGEARFAAAVARAAQPAQGPAAGWRFEVTPAVAVNGEAMVTGSCTAWDARLGIFQGFLRLDRTDRPVAVGQGKVGDLLRAWYQAGTAAGNHGDAYDNHDGDHSNMSFGEYPQITRLEFGPDARKRNLHYGMQLDYLYNAVVIGNSSTAQTQGPFWRSQGRNALTQPRGPGLLYLQYRANHLYMYPEHRDHDPAGHEKEPGHGDVLHANVPYYLMSQGSSGSDRAFLNAAAATLAAFRPEVKARLAKAGLLMPTVQLILRKSQKTLAQASDYFTGKAHPTAFDSKHLDVVKMVTLAQAITPEALPPLAMVKVEREELGAPGRDYFDVAAREKLFDTPCAIARMVKSVRRETRMVLSGRDSLEIDRKPLTYRWVILRGDGDRIAIKPLEADGSRVELAVAWHEPRPIAPGEALESSRVDVALFVSNGVHDSPPAFISLCFPADQKRTYVEDGRVQSVDYADPVISKRYVDPALDFKKDWRDDYHYDPEGRLTGWTRTRGDVKTHFTADGLRILERDARGLPSKTQPVRYTAQPGRDGVPKLIEQEAPAI